MKPITIKELFQLCANQIQEGNGDKVILLSDDDEGNGYHYCWYAFTPIEGYAEEFVNEDIAKKEDTMILG